MIREELFDMINIVNIHFIGIGGIGMSALARLFLTQKKIISGSDSTDSSLIHELINEGMTVQIGHHAKNVPLATEMVVYSNAVPNDNPEILEAKRRNLPLLSYFEALGQFTKNAKTLAICGTHGKSTTTALLSLGLIRAGFDPSVIIGTKLREFGGKNMRNSCHPKPVEGDNIFVIEACEYRRAFLNLHPSIIIITNMEAEHLDYYRDFADYTEAFRSFIKKLPPNGILVFPYDDLAVRALADEYTGEKWSFGLNSSADVYLSGNEIFYKNKALDTLSLKIPGEHNRRNALAALTGILAFEKSCAGRKAVMVRRSNHDSGKKPMSVTLRQAQGDKSVPQGDNTVPQREISNVFSVLHDYQGAWRRFEYRGKFQGAKVYDDYAHHPTEIRATLSGARELFLKNHITVVFQPHQFNRTKNLFDDFAHSFDLADTVIIPNIYEVRDQKKDRAEVSAEKLVSAIKKNHQNVEYTKDFAKTIDFLKKNIHKNDVLIIMGAGDVYEITDVICTHGAKRSAYETNHSRSEYH
ncbi:UDP-N-acetylmuramate--L-alanine ligase [Candidatus Peregrinibacteria bacterium]|nr:UDP-N-acetylmuramate--L-alanine ligase [Candidatus Peregrinibacteria bacterium]